VLDPSQQSVVYEPSKAILWSYDRNLQQYVRFTRRWTNVTDANGKIVGEEAAYGRDPKEVYLNPEQLTHLIAWMRDDRDAWVAGMTT